MTMQDRVINLASSARHNSPLEKESESIKYFNYFYSYFTITSPYEFRTLKFISFFKKNN